MFEVNFFVSSSTINVKILENEPVKSATHATDFKKMFLGIDTDDLQFCFHGIDF